MVKIKQKKTMNLPQLIEWAWDNDVRNKGFESERTSRAYFDYDGYLSCTRAMEPTDTFTVETEEEITEDTVIDEMLLIYDNGVTHIAENKNLSFISKGNLKSAYYMNDELRLILIWRDGKLVE